MTICSSMFLRQSSLSTTTVKTLLYHCCNLYLSLRWWRMCARWCCHRGCGHGTSDSVIGLGRLFFSLVQRAAIMLCRPWSSDVFPVMKIADCCPISCDDPAPWLFFWRGRSRTGRDQDAAPRWRDKLASTDWQSSPHWVAELAVHVW